MLPLDPQYVKSPDGRRFCTPRPSTEQETRADGIELALDEQLSKRRVRQIVVFAREDDFRIAGHFDLALAIALVRDRQPPHLDVVFRSDRDLELRLEVAVPTAVGGLVELEDRLEVGRRLADRLIRG